MCSNRKKIEVEDQPQGEGEPRREGERQEEMGNFQIPDEPRSVGPRDQINTDLARNIQGPQIGRVQEKF